MIAAWLLITGLPNLLFWFALLVSNLKTVMFCFILCFLSLNHYMSDKLNVLPSHPLPCPKLKMLVQNLPCKIFDEYFYTRITLSFDHITLELSQKLL